jgi:hypothetical protein
MVVPKSIAALFNGYMSSISRSNGTIESGLHKPKHVSFAIFSCSRGEVIEWIKNIRPDDNKLMEIIAVHLTANRSIFLQVIEGPAMIQVLKSTQD